MLAVRGRRGHARCVARHLQQSTSPCLTSLRPLWRSVPAGLHHPAHAGGATVAYWVAMLATWLIVVGVPLLWPYPASLFAGPLLIGVLLPSALSMRASASRMCGEPSTDDIVAKPQVHPRRPSSGLRAEVSILIVNVERLRAALREKGSAEVLYELTASALDGRVSPLLDLLPARQAEFALVSYRQEASSPLQPGPAHSHRPAGDVRPTIDAEALASLAEVAATSGMGGFWLDAWCYHNDNGVYDHAQFCATLRAVTTYARQVLWLPRARRDCGDGSYQFRLWPTFEAAVVAQRQLPVRLAGVGLSSTQRLLRVLGSAYVVLPGLGAPREILELACFNTALSVLLLFAPWMIPFAIIFFRNPRQLAQLSPTLGHQAQLARSAATVLQVMREVRPARSKTPPCRTHPSDLAPLSCAWLTPWARY